MTLTAAVVPMLTMERFRQFGWSQEMTVLVAAAIYLAVRFGVAELFKRFTVHRGMWHSVPACLIAGLIAFLLVSGVNLDVRVFKAVAVMVGFMSHLVLDEIWSFSLKGGRFQIKKSFGTAIKFWGKSRWANFATYAKLAVVTFLAVGDPFMMHNMGYEMRVGNQSAQAWLDQQMRTANGPQPEVVPPQALQPTQFPPEDWRR